VDGHPRCTLTRPYFDRPVHAGGLCLLSAASRPRTGPAFPMFILSVLFVRLYTLSSAASLGLWTQLIYSEMT
jgi:hypothetical protein